MAARDETSRSLEINFINFPIDIQRMILLEIDDIGDLQSMCLVNKSMEKLCNDGTYWGRKILNEKQTHDK